MCRKQHAHVCSKHCVHARKQTAQAGWETRTHTKRKVPGSVVPVGGLATFVIGSGKGFTISTSCLELVYGGCRSTAPTLLLVPN